MVFRAISDAKKKKRNDTVSLSVMDIYRELPETFKTVHTDQMMREMLREMDKEGQVHFDEKNDRIYT